jgi:hypothetical protein
MKLPVAASALLATFVLFAACGGAKKDADNPSNTEDDASSSSDDGGGATAELPPPADSASASGGSGKAAPGDDGSKKNTPCGGFDIADLASVLSQADCEVANPNTKDQKDLKDTLEVRVVPDSPRIAPGSTATITVTLKNKGKTDLSLDFVVDPEPRFDFELYTLKGSRVDKPSGSEPSLPPEVANAPQPDQKIARVKIAQQGTAKLTLKWNAVTYKWASKDRAKGALPGHGYPKEPAGPLKKGTYILRVITPLTGIFEGIDHEISQPRVQITVGGMP